jgi:membrane protein implicated in regulation of membrane protease activity
MSERLIDRIPFAKIMAVLATVFGISLGLCGATFFLSIGGSRGGFGGFFVGLGVLELIAIFASAALLVLTLVVFVTLWIISSFSENVSQPQKLFDEEHDTKNEKNE